MIFLFVYFNCPANPQFCCLLEIYLAAVIILSNDPCTPRESGYIHIRARAFSNYKGEMTQKDLYYTFVRELDVY
jgi:hypothetical protein